MLTPEDFKRKEEPVEQQPPAEEVVEATTAPEAAPAPQAAAAAAPVSEGWAASVEAAKARKAERAGDSGPSPEEIALGQKDADGNYQPTENTAEKASRDEGFITKAGEFLDYALMGGLTQDTLNAGAAGLNAATGGRLQGLDDAVLGNEEMEAAEKERREGRDERLEEKGITEGPGRTLLDTLQGTADNLEAVSEGAQGGVALPATIAGRLLNQATPWADPPEHIKQSPVGSTIFEVTQVMVPTLLTGGVAAGYGLPAVGTSVLGLAGESAMETATQDSAEDLIAGRSAAGKMGELADYLGFDGSQLTRDLIEGTKPNAQAINALAGFIQNFGINIGANSLTNQIGSMIRPRGSAAVDEVVAAADGRPTMQGYMDELRRVEEAAGGAEFVSPEDVTRLGEMQQQVSIGDELKYLADQGQNSPHVRRTLRLPNSTEVDLGFTRQPDGTVITSWDVEDGEDIGQYGRRVFSEYQRLFRELEPGTPVKNYPAPDGYGTARSSAQARQTDAAASSFEKQGKEAWERAGYAPFEWDDLNLAEKSQWMRPLIESGEIELATTNVRARLYQRAGFGEINDNGDQWAIVRSAPDSRGRIIEPFYSNLDQWSDEFGEELARAQDQARSYQPINLPEGYTPDAPTRRTAEILGQDPEDVERAIADVTNPAYSPSREVTDAMDIDSQVPVSRPSEGNSVISNEAMTRTLIGADGLTTAQRPYFTNMKAVVNGSKKRELLEEAASNLRNLRGQNAELGEVAARAAKWLKDNGELSMDELRQALVGIIEPLDSTRAGRDAFAAAEDANDITKIYREIGQASPEGMMVLPILLEEATLRLQKAATIAANVDDLLDVPFDATKAFKDFLDIQDYVEELSIPLRRGKRQWSTTGKAQQRSYRRFMEKMLDDVDETALGAKEGVDSFIGYGAQETPLRQLYNAWEAGDDAAGETFKQYLQILKGMPTDMLGVGTKNMNTVLRKALSRGNTDAVQQLFYAFMLSRPATQLAAFGGGLTETVIQPLGKMAQGIPLISSPGGAINDPKARATFFRGVGEFYGGLKSIGDGLSEWRKAFQSGNSLTSSAKIESGVKDIAKKRLELRNTYNTLMEQLNRDGVSEGQKFNASLTFAFNNMALHPLTQLPMRALTATDSGLGLVIGNQKAYGRAFARWSEEGGKLVDLIPEEFDKIWSDGVKYGSFKDTEVVMGIKELMLQNDIPDRIGGAEDFGQSVGNLITNTVDTTFGALDDASKNNWFFKYWNPFVRLSYQSLETAARYSLLQIPGVADSLPKYKRILSGQMGEIAKQQLESQIAFSRLSTLSLAGIAWQGGLTGKNPPDGLPRDSFIVPAPGTAEGYMAVPYGKLQPFATYISLVADATNGVRDGVLNQGEYDRYVAEMIYSVSLNSFESNFMIGMQNMVDVMASKTWTNKNLLMAALSDAASPLSPRVLALAGNIQNPYREFLDDETNPTAHFANLLRNRMLGGAGMGGATQYNIYNGKKIPRVATFDGATDNYWAAAAGVAFAEVAWPGKVQNAEISDRQKKMGEVKFEVQRQWYKSAKIGGAEVNLTPDEQSQLSQYLGEKGDLATAVDDYFKSKSYKQAYTRYVDQSQQDRRKRSADGPINNVLSDAGLMTANADSEAARKRIWTRLSQIHNEAKEKAVIALFQGNPDFDDRLSLARLSTPNK